MGNAEIVYTCHSTNNKNVRANELKILRKIEEEVCFEFGESESNIKKRYYDDIEILNKDFEEVKKIKEKLENNVVEVKETEQVEEIKEVEEEIEEVEEISSREGIFRKRKK